MQWGRFVCPSCYQKRKNPIFELIYKALGDFQVPVSNLLEVVLHVKKAATFGVQKVNGGQDICSRDTSVGNEKNCEKQAQSFNFIIN